MRHTMVHEQLQFFYRGFRRDAHPMAIMCGVVGALSAFYHDALNITDESAASPAKPAARAGRSRRISIGAASETIKAARIASLTRPSLAKT